MLELFFASARLATPLIFAAMGGLLVERSGLMTICLEGILLLSAFSSAVTAYYTQDAHLCLLVGLLTGILGMALHWFLTQTLKVDDIISGVAINLLALGITPFLSQLFFENTNNTPSISLAGSFLRPSQLPVLAFCVPFILTPLLSHTVFGLHLRSAGENPSAFLSLGGKVKKTRWGASVLGGALVALGGVYLSQGHASQFVREMTAGRGFIALAAIIFGRWQPLRVFAACFFFGFCENIPQLLSSGVYFSHSFPTPLIQMLPYLLTLLLLFFSHPKRKLPTWAK